MTYTGTATRQLDEVFYNWGEPHTLFETERSTATARLQLDDVDVADHLASYAFQSGVVQWEARQTGSDGCSGAGGGTVALSKGYVFLTYAGPEAGKYDIYLTTEDGQEYPTSCFGWGSTTTEVLDWLDAEGRTDSFRLRGSHTSMATEDPPTTYSETWDFAGPGCKPPSRQKGPGYAELVERLKVALTKLYALLDEEAACYQFGVGYRSKKYQDDLRRDWHKIADRKKGDNRTAAQICSQLQPRFAQCPTKWAAPDQNGKRVALGGPAKASRHSVGEAADLKVAFPPEYEWDRRKPAFLKHFPQFQAAARKAKLCGPPDNDKVHVELPYTRMIKKGKGKKAKSEAVFQCWFPPGDAPK